MFVGSTVHGALNGGAKGALWGAFTSLGFIFGGAIGAGITSGIAAEAQGGNFGQGFAGGFVSGAVMGAMIYAQTQGLGFNFGNSAPAVFAKEIANDFTRGFAIGTLGGLASGRKFSDAAEEGLLSGGFSAGSTQATNLIGHIVGFVGSGFQGPRKVENGVFYYDNKWGSGALTIGHAITATELSLKRPAPLGDKQATYPVEEHELIHVAQSRAMGMFYVPAFALTKLGSYLFTGTPNVGDPLERLISKPAY